ncbi:MAG TPA: ATPase, T2SS/T4P/T4SS family [bacterium]|nr:ATPase, T2SS/T4P/T4SS family [bacterium]
MNEAREKQGGCRLFHEIFPPSLYPKFKAYIADRYRLSADQKAAIAAVPPSRACDIAPAAGIDAATLARAIAEFLEAGYAGEINPEDVFIDPDTLDFCKKHGVVLVREPDGGDAYVMSNPFNWELLDTIDDAALHSDNCRLRVAQQDAITDVLTCEYVNDTVGSRIQFSNPAADKIIISQEGAKAEAETNPVVSMASGIIARALLERASDIHIEPKENKTVVRFRVDGEMRDVFTLKRQTGAMVISRYKVIGGLDIAEKRRPQDGSVEAVLDNKMLKLRMATSSTPHGESMVIRILDSSVKPKQLNELGMTEEQTRALVELSNHTQGMILVVGPTGSGKTTTIYSLLIQVDCKSRSLMSVEDPVEYVIPYANQQQANERAGITFASLLKSAVRQDPDILFLGEIRDQESAKIAVDFASTGHITISTLHTSNATTAVFRLERLAVSGGVMADTMLAIIAQRLVKKLCPACKKVEEPTAEDRAILAQFTGDIPGRVGHPAGCPKCRQTGYLGRVGVYEVLRFDKEISQMIRAGKAISDIRAFVQARGDYLLSNHAIEKVRQLELSPKDAYENVLVEEVGNVAVAEDRKPAPAAPSAPSSVPAPAPAAPVEAAERGAAILVAEDDPDTRSLIERLLGAAGYEVSVAGDGIEALLLLGKQRFDLILSDINMPHLDGFKLLEMAGQKGITSPVVFLTASGQESDEAKSLELGVADFMTKPIKKEVLLARIKKILQRPGRPA